MTTDEVLVLANDVIPGMGLPVAAPGLRAWGNAEGLRRHGHDVTIVVDENVVRRAWRRRLPWPTPSGTLVVPPRDFAGLVRTRRPRFVVITNSNHAESLGDLGETALIYDFFAPKMLEMQQQVSGAPEGAAALERLRMRKLAALARCEAVIVNGPKKVEYARGWLRQAGRDPDAVPTPVVLLALPVQDPFQPEVDPVHAVVTGYVQPWSQPGEWAHAVEPLLKSGSLVLHMLVGRHWGGRGAEQELPDTFSRLLAMPGVISHGALEFRDFQRFLAGCHLSIDLFERGPERELAMVTRTAVALASGLPVVHVPFTETGELIREYDAGWLVDSQDTLGIAQALESAVTEPKVLAAKRSGAQSLAHAVLDIDVATKPLDELLRSLR